MSDYPERSVQTMRRQLEMILEFDDDLAREIQSCTLGEEVAAIDALDEADVSMLRQIGSDQRELLFDVDEADAQALLDMSDQILLLGEAEYSSQRHEFHLRRNFVLAKYVGGLAAALESRAAAEEIVKWINTEQNGSPETNKDYRVAFRMFGELASEGEGKPESISWVPGGYPSTHDPAPQPEKMFRWEEHIVPMLESCHNSRDRALIALAWDLGPRPSELFDLTVGRFTDHKYGKQVTLYGGKRGTRSPVIVPSTPYVQQWFNDHPASSAPDAPLWTRLNEVNKISNNRIRDIFKERAEAAEMTPPSTPTPSRMRKSSATHLASEGDVSQPHLEDHHGWDRGSSVAARYISVFGDANDREIARAHGVEIDEDDEPDDISPITCPRCSRETPPDEDVCMWCGQALSASSVEEIKEQTRETRAELLSVVQDNPALVEDIESAEEIVRLVDETPEALDDARAFIEALEAGD